MAKCLYPWKHSIEELPDVQYENDKAISGAPFYIYSTNIRTEYFKHAV